MIALLLFLNGMLQAHETSVNVSSEAAVYNGKKVELTGDVVVQHSLGQISAHRLSFLPEMDKKTAKRYASLEVSDGVEILLKEGGQLHCQES